MHDPIQNLPATPYGVPPAAQGAGHAGASPSVSIQDIKDFISPKLYGELAWDENRTADEVTADCIERGQTVAKALIEAAGQEFTLYSATQTLVVKMLTLAELYRYNGDKRGYERNFTEATTLVNKSYKAGEEKPVWLPSVSLSKAHKRSR